MITVSCTEVSDPTTSPPDPSLTVTTAAKAGSPSITALDAPFRLEIGVASAQITVTVHNPGRNALRNVSVVTHIRRGNAQLEFASVPVTCPNAAIGIMPAGATCSVQLSGTVGNGTTDSGNALLDATLLAGKKALDTESAEVYLTTGAARIVSFVLPSTPIVAGSTFQFSITIDNTGPPQTNVYVAAIFVQGTFGFGGGSRPLGCSTPGWMLTGSCTFTDQFNALSLQPGTAELHVLLNSGTTGEFFDVYSTSITLVSNSP
jgi:hypothetical protein